MKASGIASPEKRQSSIVTVIPSDASRSSTALRHPRGSATWWLVSSAQEMIRGLSWVDRRMACAARAPNEVWSWDITKLMGPAKWTYFYLYVIIDIFSRRIVGWCVADRESATVFTALFSEAGASSSSNAGLKVSPASMWVGAQAI